MPWTAADAESHTKEADTPKKQKVWAQVANKALEDGASDASAIKQANAAVANMNVADPVETRQPPEKNGNGDKSGKGAKGENGNGDDEEDEDDDDDDTKNGNGKKGEGRAARLEIIRRDGTLSASPSSSFNPNDRTVEALISTGARVRRSSWFDGDFDEVLDMGSSSIRMGRLNAGAALLDAHNAWGGIDAMLGAVVPGTARIEGTQLWARIKFSRSEKGERVARDLQDGIPIAVSVGYRTHKEVVDDTTSPPTRTAIDWEPFEVSVAPIPADAGAGFRAQFLNQRSNQTMTTEAERAAADTKAAADAAVRVEADKKAAAEAADKQRAEIIAAETTRTTEILAIARTGGLDNELAEKAIKEGVTVEAFRTQAFERLAERVKDINGTRAEVIRGDDKEVDGLSEKVRAMSEALMTRIIAAGRQPAWTNDEKGQVEKAWAASRGKVDTINRAMRIWDGQEQPQIPRAREFMGKGFSELAAECLGYRGNIIGYAQQERLIERAFQSTSDYPSLFENVMHKTLLARYELAAPTYRQLATERPVVDFRPHPQYRAGDFPQLQPLTETGELRYGASQDSKETLSVSPYGIIFSISRQMIVNDDMSSIDQIISSAGVSVLIFENVTFFTMFNANPTLLQDSTTVFHANHGNTFTTTGPPSIDTIGTARKALRGMKSLSGLFLNIPPAFMLTGPTQETVADQMVTAITPTFTTSVNPFSGKLRNITDANITGKEWYIATEPGAVPCFVYAFLGGAGGPRVRTDVPFGKQGTQMSLEHDFGVGAIDYRGWVRSDGGP